MTLHITHGWLPARPNMGWSVGGFYIDPATKTRNVEYAWVLQEVSKYGSDLHILDAAAGYTPGWHMMADILAAAGHTIVALDIDERSLQMPPNDRIERKVQDISNLSNYDDDSFDVSICISVLEHTDNNVRTAAYQELLRVSKKAVILTADYGFGMPCELLFIARGNADLERKTFFGDQMEPPVYFCVVRK